MAKQSSGDESTQQKVYDLFFLAFIGFCLGILGSVVNRTAVSMVGAALMLGLFGAYSNVLQKNVGLISGLTAGGIMGLTIGVIGFLLGGKINDVGQGALFGLIRGVIIGAVVGGITRAQPDPKDKLPTKLFLFMGSVFVGAVLGAGVGLVSGVVLGFTQLGWWGKLIAALVGLVVGGYLGSYYHRTRSVVTGALVGMLLALTASVVGGAVAGVVLGMMTGAISPMLLVAAIGAYGGLTSRGLKAMLIEASEAPTEMLLQGAVPFLAPAVMVGLIVGTAASGAGGIIALPICLGSIGMLLGVLGEIEGQYSNRVTVRKIVEMIIIGADEWPISQVSRLVTGADRRLILKGIAVGSSLGLVFAGLGVFVGQQLLQFMDRIV